jgi:hypothetical protein
MALLDNLSQHIFPGGIHYYQENTVSKGGNQQIRQAI